MVVSFASNIYHAGAFVSAFGLFNSDENNTRKLLLYAYHTGMELSQW
jgi:hypothetical protein